jgi:hypothetical protein
MTARTTTDPSLASVVEHRTTTPYNERRPC